MCPFITFIPVVKALGLDVEGLGLNPHDGAQSWIQLSPVADECSNHQSVGNKYLLL